MFGFLLCRLKPVFFKSHENKYVHKSNNNTQFYVHVLECCYSLDILFKFRNFITRLENICFVYFWSKMLSSPLHVTLMLF